MNIAGSCVKPLRQSALFDCLVKAISPPLVSGFLQPGSAPDRSAVPSPRYERILVAEDNEVNQQVALGNLRKLGYQNVGLAANGSELLKELELAGCDIIFMDCQMPELDGYAATKEIRRREGAAKHTWIIAMTANVMTGDREKCFEAGMDDYVSKPLSRRELHAALERAPTAPVQKPLDGNVLRYSMEGWDDDEFADLVNLLVALAPAKLADMRTALVQPGKADLSRAAHGLRGCCSNFGESPIVALCAKIEEAEISGNTGDLSNLVASVEKEWYRLKEALEPYRKQKAPL